MMLSINNDTLHLGIKMASHYSIKHGLSFNTEEEAKKYIVDNFNGCEQGRWTVAPCYCDNLTRAERLAFRFPRLFMWLLKREYNPIGE